MLVKIVRFVLISAALLLLLFITWFSSEFYHRLDTQPNSVVFEVEKGQSAKEIALNLKKNGIIKKTWPFLLGYRIFFSSQSLKAGEYVIAIPDSPKNILQVLSEGSVYLHSITIPEGLIIKEIAQLLESEGFAAKKDFLRDAGETSLIYSLDTDAPNLEGYLFPETYRFAKGTPSEKIVAAMIFQFTKVFSQEWMERAAEMEMSIRDIVTLASLIEKETSLREEKKIISAVFHNRLRIDMKLDCDPTIIYVLKLEDRFKDRLRTKDLKYDSPFNTYLYSGLPPGPIANPGRDSLEAALYPADEKFLYFVSKNDGSHHFSQTFREHQNAVNKYQRR
ncbi:MAG: endolytic transglycosylase MltG [Candidatus Aminicenantes bacterium]|nr:MAG: endolytic transglycosylase MltG [Candidatus Aminicenantes bacterium]